MTDNSMNPVSTVSLARHLGAGLALVLGVLANPVCGQMIATPGALIITNYQGYILAGDTGLGGRQAIQTADSVQFTIPNNSPTTNVFLLNYQLLDPSGQPVPILDEKGLSNVVYAIYETNTLPVTFGGTSFETEGIVFYAPLQPVTPLNYYENYTPQLQVYSSPLPANGLPVFQLAGQTNGLAKHYLDFTNTASPDVAPNLQVVMNAAPNLLRQWSISNSPSFYGYPVAVSFEEARYDDFTLPPAATNLAVTLSFQLLNTVTHASVPLQSSQTVINTSIASNDGSTPPNPTVRIFNPVFNLLPAVQLDSVNATYQVVVSLAHTVGSTMVNDYTNVMPATQLLDFNGQFYFGPLLTYFTNLDQPPSITGTTPGTSVECQLAVSANTGRFPQAPGFAYGSGQYLDANLWPDGSVHLASGSVPINAPTSSQTVQNISFQTVSPTLGLSGASEGVTLTLPTGFSVTPSGSTNRLTVGAISLGTVPLDDTLNPQNVTISGPIQAVGENVPFWFYGSSLLWNVTSGTLALTLANGSFVRQSEDDLLTGAQSALADPNMANRVSNDGYFRNAAIVPTQTLVVSADSNGIAQLSGYLQLNPPELRPHFPYSGSQDGVQISIGTLGGYNGALRLDKGAITADSFLAFDPGFPAPLIYGRDTQDTNCASALAGPGTMYFTPQQGGPYRFNADGGLLASGAVPVTNLTWGYVSGANYAQEALNVQNGVFEMAGTFLAGGQSQVTPSELPAVLLLSGFGNGTNTGYVERPGTQAYYAGLASYPGINITSPATGSSCLGGGTLVNYSLASDAKYYARFGGVSGIHDAINFPASSLQIYGYSFTFTSYRLSYLDSQVDQSLVAGAITFSKDPSGFTQPFTNMLFSDRGYLESATVPPSSGMDHLNYWNVDLTPESMEFAPQTSDTCGTGPRFLVLGVETQLPLIPQKLHAALGFHPDGNLVTVADNVAGCDSRFAVPAHLSLQSHSEGAFQLTTATEGYFNNYQTAGRPDFGFFNLAGKLRVPFFTDVRVHLHVQPLGSTDSVVAIMGGWPDPSTKANDEGWDEGQQNFFNTPKFDPSAQGFPADQGVSCTDYEQSQSILYHPQAQRDWIQVAAFDYSLQWDSLRGRFTGYLPGTTALPMLTVGSNLKEITPGKVDMDFAADINLQLPTIKVLDLVNDATGADGAFQSLSNAIRGALGSALDNTGLNELQGLLREDPTTLFQPILTQAFSSAADQIYTDLAGLPQSNPTTFLQTVHDHIQNQFSGVLLNALQTINGGAGQANTLVGQINQNVADAEGDVNQFVNLLAKDAQGGHHAVGAVVGQLINDQASVLGPLASQAQSVVPDADSFVTNYFSALDDLHSEFKTLTSQFNQTLRNLTNSSSDFVKALAEPLNQSSTLNAFVAQAAADLTNYLAGALTPAGDYFTANPDAVKQAIQQQLQNAFLNSPVIAGYQTTLRQFLFDDNATLGELMDDTFDQINSAIRDGLEGLAQGLDTDFSSFNNLSHLASAKIRGSPTFNGDSLRKIHLDASVQMNLPNPMTFNAYMEIKELCSQTVPVDCIPQGDAAAEVTLGAKNVKLDWPALNPSGTPLTLTVAAKWTLQDGNVIGVGGLFDVQGQIGVDGYSLNEIGATLAFGEVENYFAAKVAGTFTVLGVPINANGGIFVGSACTVNPILWIDPQAASTLAANNLNSFSGIYVDCGASLSLSEILFGESSCMLDLGATISGAVYYECTSWPNVSIGMRQSIGVNASLLCLISGSASVTLSEIAQASLPGDYSLTLAGDAQVCGSIGPCPFCISGCKDFSIVGTVRKGGIDYHVNY